MGILSFFRNRRESAPSAAVAKGRLQVLIAHERTTRNGPEYLPRLKQDIVDVIKKYVNVGEDQVMVKLDTQDNRDVLELNITLPEDANDDAVVDESASSKTNTVTDKPESSNGSTGSGNPVDAGKAADTSSTVKSSATGAGKSHQGNGKSRSSNKKNKGGKKRKK